VRLIKRRRHTEAAFSLAEVLIALALTAISVLSLVTVLLGGMRLLETSQEVAEATGVGRELMEAIKARKYTSMPRNASFDGAVPDAPMAGGFPPAPYPAKQLKYLYKTKVEVRALDDRLNVVTVHVSWNRQSSLQMATVIPQ
jgi:Tfp pilus assembly protein PilV